MACERRRDMETNLNLNGSDEITNKPENGKGRRRSKLSNEPAQKKKKPQRGMGVAQLEKLRVQENDDRLKNQLHSLTLQNYQFGTTPSSFADPSVQMHLAKLGSYGATHSGLNQALLLQRLGTGGFQLDPYGFRSGSNSTAHNVGSTLIETTARDQLCKVPSVICYSEQCGICHKKKKRINGGNIVCNGARKMYMEMPQINGCNFTGFNVRNNQEFGRNQQEAEVVAVHRKQGINTGGGGGGGSVVMEYEFFPGKGSCCSNNNNDEDEEEEEEEELMMKVGSESSSLVGGGGVDLSLKLSY